jgi:probable O-glycosylation ligase (exosortase A-associated)
VRDLYIAMIYAAVFILGFGAPFVFSLGYVWVDMFTPQDVSWYLSNVPVALIMGGAAFASYFLFDRESPPRLSAITLLTLAMAGWVTLTTTWAVAPDAAWTKWDWAFKTVAFSAFMPYVFRTRVQIEAFLQIYMFSAFIYIFPSGIKTVISGGGYGMQFGVVGGNSGLAEGSTLAGLSINLVPLLIYTSKYSVIIKSGLRWIVYLSYALLCLVAAVGTFARTGIIGFAVLSASFWIQTRRKVLVGVMLLLAAASAAYFVSDKWTERMSTIETFQKENSALGRILVWQWTIDFVREHPEGGGFSVYVTDRIELPSSDPEKPGTVVIGKAFHSIWFEVLGEHGFPGIAIFLGLILCSLLALRRTIVLTRGVAELEWCHDLAKALVTSLLVMCACGSFIGVAFQPYIWYLFATANCLRQYVHRVQQVRPAERSMAQPLPLSVSTRGTGSR